MENIITFFVRAYHSAIDPVARFYQIEADWMVKLWVTVMLGVVMGLTVAIAYYLLRKIWKAFARLLRGISMAKRKRDIQRHRELMANVYCDALDESFLRGEMDRETCQKEFRKIAQSLGYWELMPRRFVPPSPQSEELKERIRARLEKLKTVVKPQDVDALTALEAQCATAFGK